MSRSRVTAGALLLLIALIQPSALSIQQREGLQVELRSFPAWVGPDTQSLGIGLDVTNDSEETASGLRLSVSIHEGVETRSGLERTFDGRLGRTLVTQTFPLDDEIGAGKTERITLDIPVAEFSFFRSSRLDRAYPVRLELRANRSMGDAVETHLIHFRTQAAVPLKLAMVISLHSPPIYSGGLNIRAEALARLQGEISESGRLDSILSAIEESGAAVTLTVSGVLLDTLSELSDGYRVGDRQVDADEDEPERALSTLSRLTELLAQGSASVALMSYSSALLPSISEREAVAQVGASRARIESKLGISHRTGWLVPTFGVIDEPTLAALQNSGVDSVVLAENSTELEPSSLTRGLPIEIDTRAAERPQALLSDAGLSQRLSQLDGSIEARQRFLAETATIMLERPAIERVVGVVTPTNWDPGPSAVNGVLTALVDSPWMRGITLDDATAGLLPEEETTLRPASELLGAGGNLPGTDYLAALTRARGSIDIFEEVRPPRALLRDLETSLLIAQGTDWWASPKALSEGAAHARFVIRTVDVELDKITAPEELTITLTSEEGTLPIAVNSEADYPMEVLIRVESDNLLFEQDDEDPCPVPQSSGRCLSRSLTFTKTLAAGSQTNSEVNTVAQASGTISVLVTVMTPGKGIVLDTSQLLIRSTDYNRVALSITLAAGAFVVLWWILAPLRRRLAR